MCLKIVTLAEGVSAGLFLAVFISKSELCHKMVLPVQNNPKNLLVLLKFYVLGQIGLCK